MAIFKESTAPVAAPSKFVNEYALLDDAECIERIHKAKATLGDRLAILGHHYQRDEVFQFADIAGDSLKLSQDAASSDAEFIVFCGVHFMAEVADILSKPSQQVVLPDMSAGCSMADMANLAKVEKAWKELQSIMNPDEVITPITYINSAADLKAFCGRHGGIVCTSSNAQKVLNWAFERREKVLFFPDQHLGRNTAYDMGYSLDDMVVWDFNQDFGGLTEEQIKNAKVILWKGFCSVHQMFKPEHIDAFKERTPHGKVISHPESSFEVCQKSDYVGSTEMILNTVRNESKEGDHWLIGTELNLVNRLADEMRPMGVEVEFMSPMVCMCSTMFRTDPQHLCWVLESLVDGEVVNQIKVDSQTALQARQALDLMLQMA